MNVRATWRFLNLLIAALCLASAGLSAPARAAKDELSGTTWQLVRFRSGNGLVLAPDAGANYIVEFKADNTLAVRLDCRRGRGVWLSRSTTQLELGSLGLTGSSCPKTPLYDQFARQWMSIRSFALRDTHLFLSSTDGGTYEFEPAKMSVAASPASGLPAQPPALPSVKPAPSSQVTAPQQVGKSWLDASKPAPWNTSGAMIPAAPGMDGAVDARCHGLARPPELEADKRLVGQGWNLVGPYQGGWTVLVIQATAGYDGMCRPRAYQVFVFLHGTFAGTLSPGTMDSRADSALSRVTLQDDGRRLVAEYLRYTAADPLCCASRTTRVVFDIASDQAVARPVSASTSSN